jgi:toxin FitB
VSSSAPPGPRARRWSPGTAKRSPSSSTGLRAAFADHIVGVDARTAEEWGRTNVPERLPVIDGLLAATARTRGWTLVTRNTADVARSGVTVLNPFS